MNKQKHWFVLAVCCGLSAASIGVSINASGVFYTPVSESLGIMRGTFSMHMTLFSLVAAFGSLFVPTVLKIFSYKLVLCVSVIVTVFATAAMGFVTTVPMFYLLGSIRGLSTAMFSFVPLTFIVNNWFVKKHGFATSLVFGFSGIAGSLCSPLLSYFIMTVGWQMSYVIKALLILCLCLPAMIYPFYLHPQKDGHQPYGYEAFHEETKKASSSTWAPLFFTCFLVFGLLYASTTSVTQHLPGYSESIGYGLSVGSFLLSASMVGNISFKLLMGVLSDAFGIIRASIITIVINVVGIALLLFGASPSLMIVGAFFFGSCYSVGAVALPLLTKHFFGMDNYAKIYPKVSFATNFGAAISLSAVGYIYDYFGSYVYAFLIALLLIAICSLLLIFMTMKYDKQSKQDLQMENERNM